MAKLTDKQKLFADEYLIDLNATRAYRAIYKSCKKDETAKAAGSRLLTNVNVATYIEKRMKDREKRTEITQDKVIQELAKIGFADITDFAKVIEKSYMKPILDAEGKKMGEEEVFYKTVDIAETSSIPLYKIGAIASIKQGANGIEIKTNDKVKALELIGKHLGMFKDKVEVTGSINNPFEELTTEELKKLIIDD